VGRIFGPQPISTDVGLEVAERLGMTVARVSYYAPYSVAELAWTLAMAVNRVKNVLDYRAGRRSENVLVPRS
jgi:lactate dehydrogenase-like 2-hydroxyacid dehydrogenase